MSQFVSSGTNVSVSLSDSDYDAGTWKQFQQAVRAIGAYCGWKA